jgi:hypothetical protein
MPNVSINWWAILVAVVSNFVIAGVWYSPTLFMKPYLTMSGVGKPEFDAGLRKALIGDLFSFLAMAFVLIHVIRYSAANDLGHGLLVTFWTWLGFVAAVLLGSVTYEHRPFKYFAINAGYRFVALMVMGSILTLWK